MSEEATINYRELKRLVLSFTDGLLFGVASLDGLQDKFDLEIKDVASKMGYGISIAKRLPAAALETITDHPNRMYKHIYRQTNIQLDNLALLLVDKIQGMGYSALPIPASVVLDWRKQNSHFSHRHLAVAAGIGWWGRNNLVVTPQYGSQVRLVSILTDMPLKVDTPLDRGCGDCIDCISACPAGALSLTPPFYNFQKCYGKLREFAKKDGIGYDICGVCIKVCKGKEKLYEEKLNEVSGEDCEHSKSIGV